MKNIFTLIIIFSGLFMAQSNAQLDTLEIAKGTCNEDYLLSLNGQELSFSATCKYALDASDIVTGVNEVTIEDASNGNNSLNGVTTLDMVLLFRGLILGFSSNDQIIASDFDGDNVVSTQDLVSIRRVILGLDSGDGIRNYRILDTNYVFPPDFGPFNFGADFGTYTFNSDDLGGENLPVEIIKSGDLNGSVFFQSEESPVSREAATLSYQEKIIQTGEIYTVTFDLNSTSSFQASTFELIAEGLNILSVDENENDILYNSTDETSKISFLSDHPESSVIFSIEVEATADGMLSDMLSLDADYFQEVVDIDGNEGGMNLSANLVSALDEFSNKEFTISPNPVRETLNISFKNYGSASPKNIELISLDGKSINNYQTINDVFSIEMNSLDTKGLHLIRVTQDGKTKVEKVLIQ